MNYNSDNRYFSSSVPNIFGFAFGCSCVFIASRYNIVKPSQYLVRTGFGINGISISKKGFHWPGQHLSIIEMKPLTYSVDIKTMSNEQLPLRIYSKWLIGPKDDPISLRTYASLQNDKYDYNLYNYSLVNDILTREIKDIIANLDTNNIIYNRDIFRKNTKINIEQILGEFGLKVYNVNIIKITDFKDLQTISLEPYNHTPFIKEEEF